MRDWLDKLERTIGWYKWLLKWHPIKYLGIALMTVGPLYFIYRYIFFREISFLFFGSIAFFVAGLLTWYIGWDPYG